MKKLFSLFAIVLVSATALTSCSSKDDPEGTFQYSAGFSKWDGETTDMKQIEDIYFMSLGIVDGNFSLNGNEKDCNKKVKKACETAQKTVASRDWSASFTYEVVQVNHFRTVYSYTYNLQN